MYACMYPYVCARPPPPPPPKIHSLVVHGAWGSPKILASMAFGLRTGWAIVIGGALRGFASRSHLFAIKLSMNSKGFKTYSVEYASDPRFKIQGARENFALHLESRIRWEFN